MLEVRASTLVALTNSRVFPLPHNTYRKKNKNKCYSYEDSYRFFRVPAAHYIYRVPVYYNVTIYI